MSNKTSDNNVATEEDIKTIKNLLQMLENGFLTEEMCPIRSWDPTPKYASALKYILAEREQKDKRIQELEEVDIANRKVIVEQCDYIQNNSIPKQVVIEKIEELDRKEQELQNSISEEEREEYEDANISYLLCDIEIRREVLEELLQESEDK